MRLLVVHALDESSRRTTIDHVLAWRRHLDADVTYLNARGPLTPELRRVEWDAAIVNYCYLGLRTTAGWAQIGKLHEFIRQRAAKLIAFPQDDYTNSRDLDDWIADVPVDIVYTPIKHDLNVLYPRSYREATFRHALTGYVEDKRLPQLERLQTPWRQRSIDVGTRVRDLPAHYGREGQRKGAQARALRRLLDGQGLAVDISTDPHDMLSGDAWFAFLGQCRFTVGGRGGASVADPRGAARRAVAEFTAKYPGATFDEVEMACASYLRYRGNFTAISPRIFDAAAMRTCQILIRDEYLPEMQPWRHYIPLDADYANFPEVLDAMRDEGLGASIADAAYEDLIASGRYSYASWVRSVAGRDLPVRGVQQCGQRELSYHRQAAGLLDLMVLGCPPELAAAARELLLTAQRSGSLSRLSSVFETLCRLSRTEPTLLQEGAVRSLIRRHRGRLPSGLNVELAADVLRQVILHGVEEGMRQWILASQQGWLAGPHPSPTWRTAESFMITDLMSG